MGLLDLPPELRNPIYEPILSDPTQIGLSGNELTPSILQVNRQIRKEATPLHQPVDFLAKIEDDDVYGPLIWLDNRRAQNEFIRFFTLACSVSKSSIRTMKRSLKVRKARPIASYQSPALFNHLCHEEARIRATMMDSEEAVVEAGVAEACIQATTIAMEGDGMAAKWSGEMQW